MAGERQGLQPLGGGLRPRLGRLEVGGETSSINDEHSPFNWVDLFGAGPALLVSWTSTYTQSEQVGAAALATPEKGREAYEEAVSQLLRFVDSFKERPLEAVRHLTSGGP